MRILVTGAAGFIGGHLVRELTSTGHDVVTTDILNQDWTGRKIDVNGYDLTDPSDVALVFHTAELRAGKIDAVVHLAAQVGRLFGEDDPRITIESNALMTTLVARRCSHIDARLVYASTSEVYGDQGDVSCAEHTPLMLAHNLYGVSKRWGEDAARLYAPATQMLRLSMPYGPGLPAGRGRAALINFLWQAATGQTLTVHRGSERSWCWVGDTVAGIRVVLERGQVANTLSPRDVGVYNVGRDDNRTSMLDVAAMALRTVPQPSRSLVEEVDAPGRQTVVKRLDDRKLRELGWKPLVGLAEGMSRTWDAIKDHLPPVPGQMPDSER